MASFSAATLHQWHFPSKVNEVLSWKRDQLEGRKGERNGREISRRMDKAIDSGLRASIYNIQHFFEFLTPPPRLWSKKQHKIVSANLG